MTSSLPVSSSKLIYGSTRQKPSTADTTHNPTTYFKTENTVRGMSNSNVISRLTNKLMSQGGNSSSSHNYNNRKETIEYNMKKGSQSSSKLDYLPSANQIYEAPPSDMAADYTGVQLACNIDRELLDKNIKMTQFISTIRGMYGGIRPTPKLYLQNNRTNIRGLKEQAEKVGEEPIYGEGEWEKTGICSISRVLKINENAGIKSEEPCPYCNLSEADPPVYQIRFEDVFDDPDNNLSFENHNNLSASKTHIEQRSGRMKKAIRENRYGNLPLGITSSKVADDNLWELAFLLQPPEEMLVNQSNRRSSNITDSLSNFENSDVPKKVPQLSTDEWAIVAARHFYRHVGVPPWQEHFIRRKRELEEWVISMRRQCNYVITRIREEQKKADCIKARTTALLKIQALKNPAEEIILLKTQLNDQMQEVISRKCELENTKKLVEMHRLEILKSKALVSLSHEEIRRTIAQIMDMIEVCNSLKLTNHADIISETTKKVFSILHKLSISEGRNRSVRKALRALRQHELFQCPHCFLLTVNSPYCPVTGMPHNSLLSGSLLDTNHFEDSSNASSCDDSEVHDYLTPSSILQTQQNKQQKEKEEIKDVLQVFGEKLFEWQNVNEEASTDKISIEGGISSPVKSILNSDRVRSSPEPTKPLSPSPVMKVVDVVQKTKNDKMKNDKKDERGSSTVKDKISSSLSKSIANTNSRLKENVVQITHSSSDDSGEYGNYCSDSHDETRTSLRTLASPQSPKLKDKQESILINSIKEKSPKSTNKARNISAVVFEPHPPVSILKNLSDESDSEPVANEPHVLLNLRIMADHISRFLGAAGDKDFKGMRKMTRKLQTSPLYSQKFSDSTLRSLVKLEEEFYAWYTSIGRPPPPNANDSANWFALVNKAKILNIKGVEQKCLTLRRELRNLEYVFNKRPKIRGAGPILDDSSIASLTLKIKELERKNTMLNIKIRQIKEQRNIIASRRKQ